MQQLKLGPFILDRPIARGGTGVVWRGRHAEQGVSIAIKILDRGDQQALQREVLAVAALNHPGIVLLYDYGTTPAVETKGSRGNVPANVPWLAMELASMGSIKDTRRQLSWAEIRDLLTSILDALAHAHARGVIHRDIKPGNVLLSGPTDPRPGLKLADFGLALAADEQLESGRIIGTPAYMSPEQLRGQWRRFGPHTDLYAVGLLAWELVCGQQAVRGKNARSVARAHLSGRRETFEPRIPVPDSLEEWIRTMSHRDYNSRFQCSADAAWALWGLEEVEDPHEYRRHGVGAIPTNPTMTLDDTLLLQQGLLDIFDDVTESDGRKHHLGGYGPRDDKPPLPPDWRREDAGPPPIQLIGAGLNLFGLRTVPMVGRITERDEIWRVLRSVIDDGKTQVMMLRGASGNGKSRLVEWISQRAFEVGGAHTIRAIHGPTGGPMDGLRPMLRRFFRILGLSPAQILPHLKHRLPRATTLELEFLHRDLISENDLTNAQAPPQERWSTVRAVLAQMTKERPVIVWLDDVQWGADSLGFARWMVKHGENLPILILCTAQSEALAEAPSIGDAVQRLLQEPRTAEVPIGPLAEHARTELVSALLGLEGDLARDLAARTAGNPLFTVQLVGDWVARGVLIPGKNGFRLRPGEQAALPDSLHEVWGARLDRLLQGQADHVRQALELAATLGQEVADSEWKAACKCAGIEAPPDLIHQLTEGRLAVPSDEGFAFSHGMLRESLVRQATENDRWSALNQSCADALLDLGSSANSGRVGLHLTHAGNHLKAVEHLRAGASRLLKTGHAAEALDYLELAQNSMQRAAVPSSDVQWGHMWLQLARAHRALSHDDQANRLSRKTLSYARRYKWSGLDASALLILAHIEQSRGNLPAAFRFSEQALESQGDSNFNPQERGRVLITLAHCSILAADMDRAKRHLGVARTHFDPQTDLSGLAQIIRFEGDIARMEMRFDAARELFQEASDMSLQAGLRMQSYSSLHGVAEMDRLSGNLEVAEQGYLAVESYQRRLGQNSYMTRLNLGQCAVARRKFTEARKILSEILEVWQQKRRPGYAAVAHIALLPAVAGLKDWDAFEYHLSSFVHLAETTGMTDIDTAINAELAGDLASNAERSSEALEAWKLSHETWTAMGAREQAARVESKLQGIRSHD